MFIADNFDARVLIGQCRPAHFVCIWSAAKQIHS
ncbi:hypothetical protein SMG44B_20184 [Stenotrophomonas maltophilia]